MGRQLPASETGHRRGERGCTKRWLGHVLLLSTLGGWSVAVALLGVLTPALADTGWPSPLPSSLTVELLGDDSGQQDIYLSLDQALPSRLRLWLAGGVLRGGENVADTTSLGIGLGSDPERDFSVAVRFQLREQKDAFRTEQVGVDFVLFRDLWMFSFAPDFRSITLFTADQVRRWRDITEIDLDSQGIELGIGYFGFSQWGLMLSHRIEDYSEDLTRIERYPRLAELLFSQGALNMAWGLDRSQTRFGITYYVPRSPLALGTRLGSSLSAVNEDTYLTAAGLVEWDIDSTWGVSLEIGGADSEFGYLSRYLSATIRYAW